jgi:hypothetical protein
MHPYLYAVWLYGMDAWVAYATLLPTILTLILVWIRYDRIASLSMLSFIPYIFDEDAKAVCTGDVWMAASIVLASLATPICMMPGGSKMPGREDTCFIIRDIK